MPAKSSEQKAIERQMKENQRIERENARRERASGIVNAAKYIGDFRVMDPDAEKVLEIALEQYNGNDNNFVTVSDDAVPKYLSNSLPLEAEKLLMYGMLSRYMIYAKSVMLTLSNLGKTYFEDKKNAIEGENIKMTENKMPMLLISHATTDKKYAEHLVTLFENIGLDHTQMICSSVPGYGIPLNKKVYDWLANKFQDWNLDLYVIFVLSDRYYASAASLNEMGAAWVTKKEYTSILLPGFEFSQIKGAISADQIAIKLDSDEEELKQRLNELKDNLTEMFGLTKVVDVRWERFRSAFIDAVKGIQVEKENNRVRKNQPSFAVKIDGINKQLPGTADILKPDFTGGTCHRNLQFSIEIVNDKVARNLIVFDKLLTTVLKSGEKCRMAVAYEDSEDVKKWPSRVTKILHSEYEDTKGLPNWFNICYQDEEGHSMVQSFKLEFFDGEAYYDLDGYPWET